MLNGGSECGDSARVCEGSFAARNAQKYLVAGGAARLQPLGMMPSAVDLSILVKVDEVHQELAAHAAHEAGGMPTHAVSRSGRKQSDVAAIYLASALKTEKGLRCC